MINPKLMNKRKHREGEDTKPLDDRIKDVLGALKTLSWMKGFPSGDALLFIGRLLAEFIETTDIWVETTSDGSWEEGWYNPLQWVVNEVARTCDWFPAPIKWRQIYGGNTTWYPLDGKMAEDLLSVIGEE